MQLVALDDLDGPAAAGGCGKCGARPLVTGIGEDAQNERPQSACLLVQHEARTVAVLNVGGVNGHAQQETERIDENVSLAARDLLGRVIALRIERIPPFGAPLALWLSMIAAVGLASRPSCSRTAT